MTLPDSLTAKIAALFGEMASTYDELAHRLAFSCQGCPDNCCDSYFLHYTYVEWAYLREGFAMLPPDRQEAALDRATEYIRLSEAALARGERPAIMCPLNEEGLCAAYEHRPMICRLHGVPATITRPDGRVASFPGCFRCQEVTVDRTDITPMERNALFRAMVDLETDLLRRCPPLPKRKMTIARMLLQEPPFASLQ